MTTEDVVLKAVAATRVAELTATAASYGPGDIASAAVPLYPELFRRLGAAGIRPAGGPAIVYYEDPAEPSDAVTVHAAIPVTADPRHGYDFAIVDLPAIRPAATILHRGTMADVTRSLWILAGWIEDNGYRPVGYHREVYLEHGPDTAGTDEGGPGITLAELQVTVARDAELVTAGLVLAPGGRARFRSNDGRTPAARFASPSTPR
jgi:effector-binding domain-containing protein